MKTKLTTKSKLKAAIIIGVVVLMALYAVLALMVLEARAGMNPVGEAYPGPGEEPGPYPVPNHGVTCTRAWDGEPCWPEE